MGETLKIWRGGLCALLLIAVLSVLAAAQPVFAHASVVATFPADGAIVAAVPAELSITFNEPVRPIMVKLAFPNGSVLLIANEAVRARDATLQFSTPSDMGEGTYTLLWRVMSADGHPVAGLSTFSIGAASRVKTVVAPDETPKAAKIAILIDRAVLYLTAFIGIGGVFCVVWLGFSASTAALVLRIATGTAILSAALAVGLQGLDVLAVSPENLLKSTTWRSGLETSYAATAVGIIVAALLALLATLRANPGQRILSLVAVLLMAAAFAASGHASDARPRWLSGSAVFLHVASLSFWIGALAPLLATLRHPGETGGLALKRFSAAAPAAITVLLLSGGYLATIQMRHVVMFSTTAYGRVLLVKLLIVAVILLIALVNRLWLTAPVLAALDGSATRGTNARKRLAQAIILELLLVTLVFVTVSVWRFTPPPRALIEAAQGPASVHLDGERLSADITVTPGVVGDVAIEIDPVAAGEDELTIRGIELVLERAGPNDQVIRQKAVLSPSGQWIIERMTVPNAGAWNVSATFLLGQADTETLHGQLLVKEE